MALYAAVGVPGWLAGQRCLGTGRGLPWAGAERRRPQPCRRGAGAVLAAGAWPRWASAGGSARQALGSTGVLSWWRTQREEGTLRRSWWLTVQEW